MSGIAGIYNVPVTQEELWTWGTTHAQHHREISATIFALIGFSLPEFVLDPINPDDTGVWEDQHQLIHQAQDGILGIAGFDLSNVNFRDPASLAAWIQLNASEHLQAADILGIG